MGRGWQQPLFILCSLLDSLSPIIASSLSHSLKFQFKVDPGEKNYLIIFFATISFPSLSLLYSVLNGSAVSLCPQSRRGITAKCLSLGVN